MCVAAAPAAAAPTCHTVQVHQRLVRHEWRRVHRRRPARGRSRGRSRRRSYTTVRIRVRVIRWRNYSVLRCGLPETGPLGSTQLVENGNLAATATVQDPAAGAEAFVTPEAGMRFVAVLLTLTDVGAVNVNGNANVDLAVLGTDHQVREAVFRELAACTNFGYGYFIVVPGETVAGCVAFELPEGVGVAQVRFGAAAFGTLQAIWR